MTHAELVESAGRWLRKSQGCSVVLTELTAFIQTGEIPDVIGFGGGSSVLVECKTSRADFHADDKKAFRRDPETGMGDYRFYMCEPGLLKPIDVPFGWGLLYAHDKEVTLEGGPDPSKYQKPVLRGNRDNELVLCVSALRRVGKKAVEAACHY